MASAHHALNPFPHVDRDERFVRALDSGDTNFLQNLSSLLEACSHPRIQSLALTNQSVAGYCYGTGNMAFCSGAGIKLTGAAALALRLAWLGKGTKALLATKVAMPSSLIIVRRTRMPIPASVIARKLTFGNSVAIPAIAKTKNMRRYREDSWLPFLDTYRTMCLAPQPDFRRVLEDVRAMQLAA